MLHREGRIDNRLYNIDAFFIMVGEIISALGFIAASVAAWLAYVNMRDSVQRDFLALQPDVQVINMYIILPGQSNSHEVLLHNLADSTAYNGEVTLDGWEGKVNISEIHPLVHPVHGQHNVCQVNLEIGLDAPIRTTRLEAPRLWIRYQDRWDLSYTLSYPVVQIQQDDGRFNIQVMTGQPIIKRPTVSFIKMRKLVREAPSL